MCIASGKTCDAQNSQGIFGESGGNVAQNAGFEVTLAVVGVGQVAVIVFSHCVDGQVATDQVFFQRDLGAGVKDKTAIAPAALAFSAGQSSIPSPFFGSRNTGKSAPTGLKPFASISSVVAPSNDAVDIGDLDAQQAVTHGAADFVDFHEKASISGTGYRLCLANGGFAVSEVNDGHVQATIVVIVVITARWNMVSFHHLIALQCFQMDVEAPQPV